MCGVLGAKTDLYEIEKRNWKNNILTMLKLRTYCTFKENYETEPLYIKYTIWHIDLCYLNSNAEFCLSK